MNKEERGKESYFQQYFEGYLTIFVTLRGSVFAFHGILLTLDAPPGDYSAKCFCLSPPSLSSSPPFISGIQLNRE